MIKSNNKEVREIEGWIVRRAVAGTEIRALGVRIPSYSFAHFYDLKRGAFYEILTLSSRFLIS